MTTTFTANITLSDSQYEALQEIYRLQADTIDEFVSNAVLGIMDAHIHNIDIRDPKYKRLEAMIEG